MRDEHAGDGVDLDPQVVGTAVRNHRRAAGLTAHELADKAGFSKSLISQIEAGKSWPSVAALNRIGEALQVSMADLLGHEQHNAAASSVPAVAVVRYGQRKTLRFPGAGPDLELLTPDLQRALEVTMTTVVPGPAHALERDALAGDVFALIRSGAGMLQIGDETYEVAEGDSLYFSGRQPHRMEASPDQPLTVVWVVSPPGF